MRSVKILFIIFAAALLLNSDTNAQNKVNKGYTFDHKLNEGMLSPVKRITPGNDSFKVVAILVQFQQDEDTRSTGDGRFDLSNRYLNPSTGRDTVIDSPPYDVSYFRDHLNFLKNYYAKSSDGKLNISFDIYNNIFTMPKKMQDYSPQRNETNAKIGNLFTDAWTAADSVINFSQYDPQRTAFVIFHAGVGRDIDLSSIFGFDPTPYDIPSVYLGLNNLRSFYGNTYNGFQTNDGFLISNSILMPSTEVRELSLTQGTFTLELGINGLMCASFGSYLGLPDLFNTSTGKTAIGRFGLMDGQSIFSFNGLFPPEPSAWEKMYLGWVSPITIASGDAAYRIRTSSGNTVNRDSTMFKVLMSESEYFLIENRNRDYNNDGQKLYIRNRAFNDSVIFTKDQDGFISFSTDAVGGNITNVDDLDWSLPGLINDTIKYKGGILIWHIDENVINSKIASNTINNDLTHRGVALMEAKGAQEIGVTFNSPFGSITGDGTIVDYWFNGFHFVPSTVYKNAFTPTTFPNSLSYSLSNSKIFITNFSAMDTLMSFNAKVGDNIISPLAGFPKFIGRDTTGNAQVNCFNLNNGNSENIFLNTNNRTYGFNSDGSPAFGNPNGLIPGDFGMFIPGYFSVAGNTNRYLAAVKPDAILLYNGSSLIKNIVDGNVTAPVMEIPALSNLYIGKNTGKIDLIDAAITYIPNIDSGRGYIHELSNTNSGVIATAGDSIKYIVCGNLKTSSSIDTLKINSRNEIFVNGIKLSNNYGFTNISQSPVLAPIDKQGNQDIILNAGNKVYILNYGGTVLDNFPLTLNSKVTSGFAAGDIDNDGLTDIIFVTENGDLNAYNSKGRSLTGFPVKTGANTVSTPSLANFNDTLGIAIIGGDGNLYAYKTGYSYNPANIYWKNYLKDNYLSNSNFQVVSGGAVIVDKFPGDRFYNWPNPTYDNKTYIRYFINGQAGVINLRIVDLSGELVTTLNATRNSNADNEVIWDVGNVQSGIYFGVIDAEIDGAKYTKIIKIAVVK
ncbi:hypothetical protein BH10BAC5_BH10BAC5_08390 [soil metagenome]